MTWKQPIFIQIFTISVFTSVLCRMLGSSNLKAAPMRLRIWGGFSPGNSG